MDCIRHERGVIGWDHKSALSLALHPCPKAQKHWAGPCRPPNIHGRQGRDPATHQFVGMARDYHARRLKMRSLRHATPWCVNQVCCGRRLSACGRAARGSVVMTVHQAKARSSMPQSRCSSLEGHSPTILTVAGSCMLRSPEPTWKTGVHMAAIAGGCCRRNRFNEGGGGCPRPTAVRSGVGHGVIRPCSSSSASPGQSPEPSEPSDQQS
jgi:hypothetical protein